MKRLLADVESRWFFNAAVPVERFSDIVSAPFLAPDIQGGHVVLSLCRIRMRRARPSWVPGWAAPSCDSAALRVGCIDRRDGSPAVWVDARVTTQRLGVLLGWMGYPPVRPIMHVQETSETLAIDAPPIGLGLRAAHDNGNRRHILFPTDNAAVDWIGSGERSYGTHHHRSDQFLVIDLHKTGAARFTPLQDWSGRLMTPWGQWPIDSAYRTTGGVYAWHRIGVVDTQGRTIP